VSESRFIKVTVEVELPSTVTDKDINEWVDVEFGECNSMKPDNPCINSYEVLDVEWRNG